MTPLTRRQLLARGAAMGAAATGLAAGDGAALAAPGASMPTERLPWGMFRCQAWNDGTMFAFGSASASAAEVGEIMELVRTVREQTGDPVNPATADFDVLVGSWQALAARLERQARASLAAGHRVSARERFLRASSYRAQALFFILGTSHPEREQRAFTACEDDWLEAIALWDVPVMQSTVSVGGVTLPLYFFRPSADGAKRPTYIVCNGSDGQNADVLCEGVKAGLDRGYNVLLFEAPGQMSLLFNQKLCFTPNWAPTINALIDWLSARSDVDSSRIAATGISFLGMVLASAGAASPGLTAIILQPGAYSYPLLWGDQRTMGIVREVQDAPPGEKAGAAAQVNAGLLKAWKGLDALQRFQISKRSEIFTPEALTDARRGRAPQDYFGTLEAMLPFQYQDALAAITIPTYVCANQLDEFFGPQPRRAYGMLKSVPAQSKFLRSLNLASGAAFHDQPLGPQVSQEFIFDWLDTVLGVA